MKKKISLLAALCALIMLLTASEQVISSCKASLYLCRRLIIPGLFPFFIISGLLNGLGFPYLFAKLLGKLPQRLFHVSSAGFSAFLMGILGGYPLGAAAISQMLDEGVIQKNEAERLLAFCNNSGPAFILGAIGAGVFNSPAAGLLLYGVHIVSALITGFILRGREEYNAPLMSFSPLPFTKAFTNAVSGAVISILNVCGFVLCFGVFTGLIENSSAFLGLCHIIAEKTSLDAPLIRAIFRGLIELGSGVGAMEALPFSRLNFAAAAFLLGFGGLSVHFQTLSLFADKETDSSLHFTGCCLKAIISLILAYFAAGLL